MVKSISWLLHLPDSSLSKECYSNVELITDRNFSISFTWVFIFRDCTMDRERVVASIMILLFLIVSVCKAQMFWFLSLCLVFERRQCDLTNALLTTRIKQLQQRRRWRGTLARRRRVELVYPRTEGWFEEMYENTVMFSLWKNGVRVSKETLDFWMHRFMLFFQEIIVVLQENKMKIT